MMNMARLITAIENESALPSQAMRARIWQQAIANGVSDTTNERHNQWLRRRMALIGVAAALILAIGISVGLFSTQPVSAAEVFSRAVQVGTNPASVGLNSYRGVVNFTSHMYMMDTKTIDPRIAFHTQQRVWYLKPGYERQEQYMLQAPDSLSTPLPVPQAVASSLTPVPEPSSLMLPSLANISGSDGLQHWDYDTKNKIYTRADRYTYNSGVGTLGATDLPSLLQKAALDYDNVKLLGNGVVAGRAVYLIEVTAKPKTTSLTGQKTIYKVDQQTYLTLGEVVSNQAGDILYEWEYADIEFNPSLEISLFTFTPPTDAKILDLRVHPALTIAALTQTWLVIAKQADYPVYAPTIIPAGMTAGRPTYGLYGGHLTEQRYELHGNPLAIQFDQSDQLMGPLEVGTDHAPGTLIQIGPYQGYYQDESGAPELQMHIVNKNRSDAVYHDTYISIYGQPESVTKADLIQLFASLQRIRLSTDPF